MADGSNLKAKIGMDTGDFEKGAKRVTKAAQSMGKDIGTSLTDVGNALGVDVGILGDLSKRIGDATTLFKGMASAGGNAASSLTKAMTGLGGAIAGLGLTAAILAFRELNSEAANFEQRLQGVNLAAAAKAARDVYKQSLYDQTGRGDDFALTKEYWQTRLSMGWQNMLTGADPQQRQQAMQAAERAAALASERVDIQRELDKYVKQEAVLQAQINTLRNDANDKTLSDADRAKAKTQAENTINVLYDKRIALQQRLADNLRETNGLVSSTDQEMREQYNAEASVYTLEAARQSQLRSFVRLGNQLASSSTTQASAAKETQEATELTLEAATALVQRQRELAQITQQNNAMMSVARFNLDGALPRGEGIQGQANAMVIPGIIKPEFDTQEWTDISQEVVAIIEDALTSVGDSVGQLIGDLVTGGDAWGNFTNNAIQAFGDMATTVGKIAVSTGLAALGIKASLETLNPYVAIAAGTALIALGAAVRAGLSNVASGNYSTSVASSSYSSTGTYGQTSFGREMEVKVSGTLTANGSQLVAVLNNENDRKNYTT